MVQEVPAIFEIGWAEVENLLQLDVNPDAEGFLDGGDFADNGLRCPWCLCTFGRM